MLLALLVLLLVIFVVLPLAGFALLSVVGLLIAGLFIGALGRLVVPGRQPIGVLATVVVGLAGALIGTAIGHAAGFSGLVTGLLEVAAAAVLVAGVSRTGWRPRASWRPRRTIPRSW